ncbi:hypothetical protein Cgig2_008224 [Carnegiea gigantea]|uniref:BZIP domain-containing protein n=1 Tax=Carnegiea gigantea TaxID=171969 RepID=A0A9Q1L2A8_9CARY|nr:hypothetical protein Cgig2_008224 [Carnegiea gigantea]
MMCSDNPVQLHPAFDGCFTFTQTDLNEVLSYFEPNPDSGLNDSNRDPSEEVNNTSNNNDDNNSNRERKLRRMISNRLSARRSRLRKRRHLENLTAQADRLKVQNREMKTRLELVRCQCYVVRRENERLRCESVLLKQRLSDLQQSLLAVNQLQNNRHTTVKMLRIV